MEEELSSLTSTLGKKFLHGLRHSNSNACNLQKKYIIFIVVVVVAQSYLTLCDPMDCSPTRLFCPWNSPGRNTGVGCHFLLQEIFPEQGLNLHLLCLLHQSLTSPRQAGSSSLSHLSPYTDRFRYDVISCSFAVSAGRQSLSNCDVFI